jgi:hypothetical protein
MADMPPKLETIFSFIAKKSGQGIFRLHKLPTDKLESKNVWGLRAFILL